MNSHNTPASSPDSSPSRRALVAGAAWSIPVIAAAAATPMAAASQCAPGTVTRGPGTHTVVVPACARTLTFNVLGSGGSGANTSGAHAGARVQGTIALPASTSERTFTLIVASGASGGTPGVGFGNGGGGSTTWAGGAGSALRQGTTLFVAAGGGGGRSVVVSGGPYTIQDTYGTVQGVAASTSAAGANGMTRAGVNAGAVRFVAGPGRPAVGATGGSGVVGTYISVGYTATTRVGNPGGNTGTGNNGGGNGGNAVTNAANGTAQTGPGGGGYAGGASGGEIVKTAPADGTWIGGGGGGGGSSFGGGPGVTVTSSGSSALAPGHAGSIVISWS